MSDVIGESLKFLEGLPIWSVVICLSAITAGVTEITSNTAISSIILPIVGKSVSYYILHIILMNV